MSALLALLIFLVAGALLIASVAAARSANLLALYQRLAEQYHGEAHQAGAFGRPTLRFTHRDATVEVTVAGALGSRVTEVVVNETPLLEYVGEESPQMVISVVNGAAKKPSPAFTCRVTPAGFLQRTAYLLGGRRGIAGAANFDLHYVIDTNDREQASRLLTRYVQVQIDRLRYLQGGNDVDVCFQSGSLRVQRQGVIRNARVLRQFVAYSLELYEQAAASFGAGIDIVALSKSEAAAVCKVCGDPFGGEEVVYCRVCDTPHHRDCWRYFGGCSVYACGERRYNRASSSRSVS